MSNDAQIKRNIAVFTGTRAEYGLLFGILKILQQQKMVNLQLFVGGTHLSADFGHTIDHIKQDGFDITDTLDFLLPSDSPIGVSKSMAKATSLAAESFDRFKPDLLLLLGDRFEALAMAQAALIARVPIAHIHGGEITEGAIDDAIRHAITKLSHLHFASTETHRKRIIQMGEQPSQVHNVGAPGIDNIKKLSLLTKAQLSEKYNFPFESPYFLVTFHPVTLDRGDSKQSLKTVLSVLTTFSSYNLVITFPNADTFGRQLIDLLIDFQQKNSDRVLLSKSLGQVGYLSAMKYTAAVIGNSSSGIIEAPSFNVPTVNIGNRQKGRQCSESVIHCSEDKTDIYNAIEQALSKEYQNIVITAENPYGDGNAAEKIVNKILLSDLNKLDNKVFFDISFNESDIV